MVCCCVAAGTWEIKGVLQVLLFCKGVLWPVVRGMCPSCLLAKQKYWRVGALKHMLLWRGGRTQRKSTPWGFAHCWLDVLLQGTEGQLCSCCHGCCGSGVGGFCVD